MAKKGKPSGKSTGKKDYNVIPAPPPKSGKKGR